MSTPTNTKEFSLEMAQQGHPLVTRDGREAKFIAYVADVIDSHKLLVQVNDEVVRYNPQGTNPHGITHWDLFLAPLGHVEGKPVFAGDNLINKCGSNVEACIADTQHWFDFCKWPSKLPVVETRMTANEILLNTGDNWWFKIANKAIERSIADGDVIPTSLFVEMACDAYNKRTESFSKSFDEIAKEVLNDYLEGLK